MSPAFAYIALIGGILYALSGTLGFLATFELMASLEGAGGPDGATDEEAREALGQVQRQLILASGIGVVLGSAAVVVSFGLFAQRLWAMYGWLALITLIALWTLADFLFGTSGWLGTLLTVLVALWSWVEFRAADRPGKSEFTLEGAMEASLGTTFGTGLLFGGVCLAGVVFGTILVFAAEMTGGLKISTPALVFLSPLVLLALFAAALYVDNERIRFYFLCAAFLTTALAIYVGAG
jgi:hypothetical protein